MYEFVLGYFRKIILSQFHYKGNAYCHVLSVIPLSFLTKLCSSEFTEFLEAVTLTNTPGRLV
jgi:hypothetical protein